MKFSVQVLAIAATVLSLNAVPQTIEPASAAMHSPSVPAVSASDPTAPLRPQAPEGAAWPLALGFLALVVMRRIRP